MTILRTISGLHQIHEDLTLEDMERIEPLFFKTKHGKRETYTVYRGFLIVRLTRLNSRETIIYAWPDKKYSLHISFRSRPKRIPQAKRFIDALLKRGDYPGGLP